MKSIDITGKKFGKLTALKLDHIKKYSKSTHRFWECICECGNKCIVAQNQLTRGKTKSCGCLQNEYFFTKHNLRHTRIYNIWCNIKGRCLNTNHPNYNVYGARGITICDKWKHNALNFYNWAMANGYTDKLTIDRIDVNGNYEPCNCRWVNRKEQGINRNTSKFYTYQGKTLCITQWAELYGIKRGTLSSRLLRGWSIEKALKQ